MRAATMTQWLAALLLAAALPSAPARTLEVEVEVQTFDGLLEPAELDGWLASPELTIEVRYEPRHLIEGRTARRIRTMPMGSRLEPNDHIVTLRGGQIERRGRALSVRLDEAPPLEDAHRLTDVTLRVPIAPGLGRREPRLVVPLLRRPIETGMRQTALVMNLDAFRLCARLRHRWSDTPAHWPGDAMADSDSHQAPDRECRAFPARHPHAGLFRALLSAVTSDPHPKPPAGWTSLQLREPRPASLRGWHLSRHHLVRIDVPGVRVDRLSIHATQEGPGECGRWRSYDALFSGEQLVRFEWSTGEHHCSDRPPPDRAAQAEWDGCGRPVRDDARAGASVPATVPVGPADATCPAAERAPDTAEVAALKAEFEALRRAFIDGP